MDAQEPSYLAQHQRRRSEDEDPFPSFPRLTSYRVLVIFLTAIFGLSKAYLSYRGYSTAPTTVDWLYGVLVFLL